MQTVKHTAIYNIIRGSVRGKHKTWAGVVNQTPYNSSFTATT